jgi:hypothetical protein
MTDNYPTGVCPSGGRLSDVEIGPCFSFCDGLLGGSPDSGRFRTSFTGGPLVPCPPDRVDALVWGARRGGHLPARLLGRVEWNQRIGGYCTSATEFWKRPVFAPVGSYVIFVPPVIDTSFATIAVLLASAATPLEKETSVVGK